ncbi:unnamed protein product, partial [Brenthis ino]
MKFALFALVLTGIVTVFTQFIPSSKMSSMRREHTVLYYPQKAKPTCQNPTIHEREFSACDIPDCFCNTPNVRDTRTNKCIPLSEC